MSINYQARIKELEAVLQLALEWHANFPHGNEEFEKQTSNELYEQIKTILKE